MKRETVALRRINHRRNSCYLTHGADNYDHRGLNRARREESKAIISDWQEEADEDTVAAKTNTEATFRVVVTSQIYENYGAHAWDGEGECPKYWKAKGGQEYHRNVGTANDVIQLGPAGLQLIADEIEALFKRDDEYYREYAIDWQVVSTDEETYDERMYREMHEEGWLAPGAKTEEERISYYLDRLASLVW